MLENRSDCNYRGMCVCVFMYVCINEHEPIDSGFIFIEQECGVKAYQPLSRWRLNPGLQNLSNLLFFQPFCRTMAV